MNLIRQQTPHLTMGLIDFQINTGVPTKKIQIFLTMLDSDEASWPMQIVVLCSARVYDLIGLICWIYTMEGRKPDLPLVLINKNSRKHI